ncbi:MAG: hypothetical protein WBH57_10635 [Anaerolineae bacterium]
MMGEEKMLAKGWVRVGRYGVERTVSAKRLLKLMGHSTRKYGGWCWCRPRYEPGPLPKLISMYPPITRSNAANPSVYQPVRRHKSELQSSFDKYRMPKKDMPEWMAAVDNQKGEKRYELLTRRLLFVSLDQLADVLERWVVPKFFEWHPQGRIYFIAVDDLVNRKLSGIRNLYGLYHLAAGDLEALKKFRVETLGLAHLAQVFDAKLHLSIATSFFLPSLYGVVASKFTWALVFFFGEPTDIRPIFPSDMFAYLQSPVSAMLAERKYQSLDDITRAINEPPPPLFDRIWQAEEWDIFLQWYVEALNAFLTQLLDLRNFQTPEVRGIAPALHFQAVFTIDRLLRQILLVLTEPLVFAQKIMFFSILDQLAAMMEKTRSLQAQQFKKFLRKSYYHAVIAPRLEAIPAPFGEYFATQIGPRIYDDMENAIIEGIFVPERVDEEGVLVVEEDGTQHIERKEDYVVNTVRAIRNTTHGYLSDRGDQRFEKYLSINRGNLPDSLPYLAPLLYLAALADPVAFFRREW